MLLERGLHTLGFVVMGVGLGTLAHDAWGYDLSPLCIVGALLTMIRTRREESTSF